MKRGPPEGQAVRVAEAFFFRGTEGKITDDSPLIQLAHLLPELNQDLARLTNQFPLIQTSPHLISSPDCFGCSAK